jgi:hypothetical protein
MTTIALRAVCSAQVRQQANNNVPESGGVSWPVDITKPFGDEVNLGRFARQLAITAPLELCHYLEGTCGDVIDLSRTPAELAYRPRMSVYVRIKKVQRKESALLPEGIGITLTPDEERLLRRLRVQVQPNLAPQDPCPLCARTEPSADDDMASSYHPMDRSLNANRRESAFSGSALGGFQQNSHDLSFGGRTKADAAVQCGNAGRINEAVLPVSFGSASRFREGRLDRPATYASSGPVLTGGNGFDIDDAASELKRQAEEAIRERDVLKRQLEDVRAQKEGLERWRSEHRCEVSKDVSKLRDENVMLHEALRDLMRGREEVFARLYERRTAGSMITDTPRQYAPFAVSVPVLDGTPRLRPSQLLATPGGRGTSVGSAASPGGAYAADDDGEGNGDGAPMHLLKRPSGAAATDIGLVASPSRKAGARDAASAVLKLDHVPGQCLLRIASVTGEPFHVKRNIASQIREGGQHVFTLLSLDGIVTDEIFVAELERCATDGPSGLILSTARHSWALYMTPSERSQWLHWFYALNPYLSAQSSDNGAGVPNSF